MDKDEIVVIDNDLRMRDAKMDKEMKKHEQANLDAAERKENARFARKTWLDKLLDKWYKGKQKVADNTPEHAKPGQTVVRNQQNSR